MLLFEIVRRRVVLALFIRQFIQQLACGSICNAGNGSRIETPCFHLHDLGLFPGHVYAQRPHQPRWPPLQKPFDVLPPDQWDVVAKALPEHRQQPVPVHDLFVAHLFEHLPSRRISLPQGVSKFAVDAPVFFFRSDGQRQNLFFR